MSITNVLDDFIDDYDRAIGGVKQCLSAYEMRCEELIGEIAKSPSEDKCEVYFDELQSIQERLAKLLFVREIDVGERLDVLTREFDRLDDVDTRSYWFKRFKEGLSWPDLPSNL